MIIITNTIILFFSFILTLFLILVSKRFGNLFADGTDGVQKFHSDPIPRIGGIGIFLSFCFCFIMFGNVEKNYAILIAVSALPTILIGIFEDIRRNIYPSYRLYATFLSGIFFVLLSGYSINRLDIPYLENVLSIQIFSIIFSGFAISGVSNSINIIDGFNGLASGALIIMLGAFAIIGISLEDEIIFKLSITFIFILLGFLILNFPFGYIFLGDTGAYFGGFFLSVIAIMLPARNPEITPWLSLLICLYPILETIISINRKLRRKGHNPIKPDRLHLHMLVYRDLSRKISKKLRLLNYRNSITGFLMWLFPLLSFFSSILFYNNNIMIIIFIILISILYIVIYRKVSLSL